MTESRIGRKTIFDKLIKHAQNEMQSWEPTRVAPISPSPLDLIEMYAYYSMLFCVLYV
jgi:hypothetical protein